MQFTDLLLGVLTEFPESPDGCHSDRLREEERHVRLRNTPRSKPPGEWEGEGDSGRFNAKPRPFDGTLRHGHLHPRRCRDSEHAPSPLCAVMKHTFICLSFHLNFLVKPNPVTKV